MLFVFDKVYKYTYFYVKLQYQKARPLQVALDGIY